MYGPGRIFLYHTHLIEEQDGFSNASNIYSGLLLRIQEVPTSNLEQEIGHLQLPLVYLIPSREMMGHYLKLRILMRPSMSAAIRYSVCIILPSDAVCINCSKYIVINKPQINKTQDICFRPSTLNWGPHICGVWAYRSWKKQGEIRYKKDEQKEAARKKQVGKRQDKKSEIITNYQLIQFEVVCTVRRIAVCI